MIDIETKENCQIQKLIDAIENGIEIGLQSFGGEVNSDIIRESRVKKSGITRRVNIGGRAVLHTSASASRGESSAELTGNQNKNRYSRSSRNELAIGVNDSVVYANKNEKRFKDIQQAINRKKDDLAAIIKSAIEKNF